MIIGGAIVDRSQCYGNSVNVSWKVEGEAGLAGYGTIRIQCKRSLETNTPNKNWRKSDEFWISKVLRVEMNILEIYGVFFFWRTWQFCYVSLVPHNLGFSFDPADQDIFLSICVQGAKLVVYVQKYGLLTPQVHNRSMLVKKMGKVMGRYNTMTHLGHVPRMPNVLRRISASLLTHRNWNQFDSDSPWTENSLHTSSYMRMHVA